MAERIHHGELLPHEFETRLKQRPVGYLPLGTLEWHGPQNPLGADFIQATAILEEAARRFGGVVLPPLWLGPDTVALDDRGQPLVGMDVFSRPSRRLPGSLYWIPEGLFLQLVEAVLVQAKRAGLCCIVAEGHGPSREAFGKMSKRWERRLGLHLISAADFPDDWATMNDHAGRNETSILLEVASELVDMERLPDSGDARGIGILGEDPRRSAAVYGRRLIDTTVRLIGSKLDELGL